MRVLLASGDRDVGEALGPTFVDDRVDAIPLAALSEPAAYARVSETRPDAIVTAPDWSRADADELRGLWWLARAADLAHTPLVLLSSAAVFDTRDRSPRTEFDLPRPVDGPGRLAHAAEQLAERTTRQLVIVRVGPADVGTLSLPRLLSGAEGVRGGATSRTSPVRVADIGPTLRRLAVGRRYGVWHLAAETLTLADCAARLGMPSPQAGSAPVPAPLDPQMLVLTRDPRIDAWPPPSGRDPT